MLCFVALKQQFKTVMPNNKTRTEILHHRESGHEIIAIEIHLYFQHHAHKKSKKVPIIGISLVHLFVMTHHVCLWSLDC
jgi:hypothetical protein